MNITGKEQQSLKRTFDQHQLHQAIINFKSTVHEIEQIKSKSDVDQLKTAFEILFKHFPESTTAQRLYKQKEINLNSELVDEYSSLLSTVIKLLLPEWSIFQAELTMLFQLNVNFELIQESLALLCGFFKQETDKKSLVTIGNILLEFLKSDCLLTSIIDCSNVQYTKKSQLYKKQQQWENFVQLIITLPQRVANKLETTTPKGFSHENYSFILMFHIIRNIDFMTDNSFYNGITYDMSYLSHLLSKFITNYNMCGNSEALIKFVEIVITWTANENTDKRKFVRKKLMHKLLSHLSRQAIDTLSVLLLRKCPINLNSKDQSIFAILGDNIDENKDWKQILCIKIPFNTTPKHFKNTIFCENLVYYLSCSQNSAEILEELVIRVGNIWSDLKAMNSTNVEQHMFMSQVFVLSVKYRIMIHTQQDKKWDTKDLKSILYKGVSKHLDSLSAEFRTIGMSTVEIILNNLISIESNLNDTHLKFDYTNIDQKPQEIHKSLLKIDSLCLLDPKLEATTKCKEETVNVQELLDFIALRVTANQKEDRNLVSNTFVTSAIKTQDQNKLIVGTIIVDKLKSLDKETLDQDGIDSDDDLQSYDMSNDINSAAKKRPAYLRDLIDKISEANDFEEFEQCLLTSEDIVLNQLKSEDECLAVELLNVFIHLECKFSVVNFDNIRFNICVAIVCCQPRVSAEHLCKEFHADVGRYSIATKILMLDVLSEAANRLANVSTEHRSNAMKKDVVIAEAQSEGLPAEEIIRRRLINKTIYFHSKREHPFAKATKNQFASTSDSFFYPLVYGFGKKQLSLSYHNIKQDTDNILLLKYLSVVGNIILASKNCPNCPKYCTEIIEMLLYLRYNSEPTIQICVMSLIASIVLALPDSFLKTDLFDSMMELRSWLIGCLSNVDLAMRLGGPRSEAAVFGGQTLHLIEKALADDR